MVPIPGAGSESPDYINHSCDPCCGMLVGTVTALRFKAGVCYLHVHATFTVVCRYVQYAVLQGGSSVTHVTQPIHIHSPFPFELPLAACTSGPATGFGDCGGDAGHQRRRGALH